MRRQPRRAVHGAGIENVLRNGDQSRQVDQQRQPADPGETDANDGGQGGMPVPQPGARQRREAERRQSLVEQADVRIVDEAPQQHAHHARNHHRDQQARAQGVLQALRAQMKQHLRRDQRNDERFDQIGDAAG